MKLLVLGGTGLAGTAIVEAALAAGHDVTAVHRGRSSSTRAVPLADGATWIELDRVTGHASLASDEWEAVIDVSGFMPAVMRDAIEHLDRPGRPYVYISTVSVYADASTPGNTEDAERETVADDAMRERVMTEPDLDPFATGTYGAAKAYCEVELEQRAEGELAILRPCVIGGANDGTWRAAYWAERVMRGGTMVGPHPSDTPVPLVDTKDLAAFAVRCAENSTTGTYNVAPDPAVTTFRTMLDAASRASGIDTQVKWLDGGSLVEQGVAPWAELPMWLPDGHPEYGACAYDTSAARAQGFTNRPLEDTFRDIVEWIRTTPADALPEPGRAMTAEREAELLAGTVDVVIS